MVSSSDRLHAILDADFAYTQACSLSDDNHLMIVGRVGEATLVDPDTGTETIHSDDKGIVTGTISADGNRYALSFNDKSIRLYDTTDSNRASVVLKNSVNEAVSLSSARLPVLCSAMMITAWRFQKQGTGCCWLPAALITSRALEKSYSSVMAPYCVYR